MPHLVPPIPLPNRGGAGLRSSAATVEPAFGAPVRWVLRVLAWLAFGVASYLAWHAVSQTSVAGCGVGSSTGCDVVLSSSWSKWLGIPVAVLGLACYAALATLSVFLGLRNEKASQWISTAFVMLSLVAAGASLWFIGVQMIAIGSFCPYCLVTDTCGIALGIVAIVLTARMVFAQRSTARTAQSGLMALRTALPTGTRAAPVVVRPDAPPPSLAIAAAGAVPLLAFLIAGQVLFASKTYDVQKVALSQSIEMVGANANETSTDSNGASTRTAMRLPTEPDAGERPTAEGDSAKANSNSAAATKDDLKGSHNATPVNATSNAGQKEASGSQSVPPPAPERQRVVKFLGGKLTLDVYQHPVIGSREAPHIVVEMVSYDCPHCRKMSATIQHALERYGDQVALLIIVEPLDKECNRLVTDPAASHQGACVIARLALGIAKLNPTSFAAFHDFLMSGDKEKPPAIGKIYSKAYVLADRSRLRDLMQSAELEKEINGYVDLFDQLQKQSGKKEFGLPVQILGDYIMTGSVGSEADVFKAWEEHLGVKPQ